MIVFHESTWINNTKSMEFWDEIWGFCLQPKRVKNKVLSYYLDLDLEIKHIFGPVGLWVNGNYPLHSCFDPVSLGLTMLAF